jgi:TetR/AcrR family transcriptional regulator
MLLMTTDDERRKPVIKNKEMSTSQRIRDAVATQTAILDSAESEFASHGLAGARTEIIAADTGVTKAMIHHYFQTKEKLYEAVIERIINNMIEKINLMKLETLPPEEAIRVLICKLVEASVYPHYPGIMANESLQNKGKYFREKGGLRFHWEIIGIVKRGIGQGVFKQVSPEIAALAIMGASGYLFPNRYNIAQLFPNQNPESRELHLSYVNQALDIVLSGLRAA